MFGNDRLGERKGFHEQVGALGVTGLRDQALQVKITRGKLEMETDITGGGADRLVMDQKNRLSTNSTVRRCFSPM